MTNNLRDAIDDILNDVHTEFWCEVLDRIMNLLWNSTISWDGFNLFGDDKSVAEVKRLISAEKRADYLQEEVLRLRKQRSKDPEFQWGPPEGREELHYYLWGLARLGYCYNTGKYWWASVAVPSDNMVFGPLLSKEAARAAVESAVRKALVGE